MTTDPSGPSVVAVTGAAGFVGCTIAELLASQGVTVLGLDRLGIPESVRQGLGSKARHVVHEPIDVVDEDAVAAAFEKWAPDRVFHCATVTAGPDRDARAPASVLRVNVEGTAAVLQACARAGVRRLVYASSSAAYGASVFAPGPLTEDGVCSDPRSLYEVTKFAAERTALRLGDLHGLDVRIGRLSTVFGPWERPTGVRDTLSPMFQIMLAACAGEPALLARPGVRDWIYSRDVASGLVALSGALPSAPRVFNVGPGAGAAYSALEWGQRLAAHFPGFVCRLADDTETPTIDLHQPADRALLDTSRIVKHTGFTCAYDLDRSVSDFVSWWQGQPAGWKDIK